MPWPGQANELDQMDTGEGLHVVLIEEKWEILGMYKDALRVAGYCPIATDRGEDALEKLATLLPRGISPIAIVMEDKALQHREAGEDYFLPLLQRLFRAWETPLPPIILITSVRGHPPASYLGVQEILCRPFPIEHLAAAIARLRQVAP